MYKPMLRVTVIMFKDIVESVTLLKEEAWRTSSLYEIHQLLLRGLFHSLHYWSDSKRTIGMWTYPLQTRGALLPASTMPFKEPWGCALLCCTAEPSSSRVKKRWEVRQETGCNKVLTGWTPSSSVVMCFCVWSEQGWDQLTSQLML